MADDVEMYAVDPSTLTESGVALLKTRRHHSQPPVEVTLQVVDINRFLIDSKYIGMVTLAAQPSPLPPHLHADTALPRPPPTFHSDNAYDITLTDGVHMTKCLTSMDAAFAIEIGAVRPGSVVTVFDSVIRYDDSVVGGIGCVYVRAFAVTQRYAQPMYDHANITFTSAPTSRERMARPLTGTRTYYLALFNDSVSATVTDVDDGSKELEEPLMDFSFISHRHYPGNGSVLARVHAISRLYHTGLAHTQPHHSPFMFEMILADSSSQMRVSVWASLCTMYYHRLHVNQMIAISGFRVKHRADIDEIEIKLNPYNPVGIIRILSEEAVTDMVGGAYTFPSPTYTMTSVSECLQVGEGEHIDVCGVITWIGRVQRDYSLNQQQYYTYRWLTITDESCERSLSIKLYTNSREAIVHRLRAQNVVVLSNITIKSITDTTTQNNMENVNIIINSNTTRYVYDEEGDHGQDQCAWMSAENRAVIDEVTQWKSTVDLSTLQTYRNLWHWNIDWEHYKQTFGKLYDAQKNVDITPIREVTLLVQTIRLLQVKHLVLQGVITGIVIHSVDTTAATDAGVDAPEAQPQPQPKRRSRPQKKKRRTRQSAAAEEAKSSEDIASSQAKQAASPAATEDVPTSNNVSALFTITLTDFNEEHSVDVLITSNPIPYAHIGGEGTMSDAYHRKHLQTNLTDALPFPLSRLLEMIPAESIAIANVTRSIKAMSKAQNAAVRKPAAARRSRSRPRRRGADAVPPVVDSSDEVKTSQESISTRTRSGRTRVSANGRSDEEQSDPTSNRSRSRGRGRRRLATTASATEASTDEQDAEQATSTQNPVQNAMQNIVESWMLHRRALMSVGIYRASFEQVDKHVATIFQLEQNEEPDV